MVRFHSCKAQLVALACFASLAAPAQAALTININYAGDPSQQTLFDSVESDFYAAANTWESLLVDHQNGIAVAGVGQPNSTVNINVGFFPVTANGEQVESDGVGGLLGFAGPTTFIIDQLDYALATNGVMVFDAPDVAAMRDAGTLGPLLLHEMAHVLGFGTLWNIEAGMTTYNEVYDPVANEFTGPNATAAWQSEFGQTGNPDVEAGGGPGTADGHWNEVDGGGALTGITDSLGRDMRDELMTGWLNPNSFISQMTVNSFIDIGFLGSVVAVPEASSFLALGLVSLGGAAVGRRR